MKTTCEFCEGPGKLQVGTGTPSSEGGEDWRLIDCDRCDGTGRVESKVRHTSLTLACCEIDESSIYFSTDAGKGLEVLIDGLDMSGEAHVFLDAAAEASLLKWLKAREEERRG